MNSNARVFVSLVFIMGIVGWVPTRTAADAYYESGDAGQYPWSAQSTGWTSGNSLDLIIGSVGSEDRDLYRIEIPDPAAFSASWTYFDTAPGGADCINLYLFREAFPPNSPALPGGRGIVGSEFLTPGGSFDFDFARITQGSAGAILDSNGNPMSVPGGTFFLAVAHKSTPVNADNDDIFGYPDLVSNDPADSLIDGWRSLTFYPKPPKTGDYWIHLSGAYTTPAPLPGAAVTGVVLMAILGGSRCLRRQKGGAPSR